MRNYAFAALQSADRTTTPSRRPRDEVDGISGLDHLVALLLELRDNRHRALVFSQFVDYLTLVRAALESAGLSYQYLDGSTVPKRRDAAVAAFQRGGGDCFLLSLKAGGSGINLTAADYVIHLDPWWNPAVEQQASDRAHRIGQTRPVTVYRLVLANSIEERILALHGAKRELMDSVLGESDGGIRLSEEDLVALIAGRQSDAEADPVTRVGLTGLSLFDCSRLDS